MKQTIKYFIKNSFIKDDFSSSKKHIPFWYKNVKAPEQTTGALFKKNIKMCSPFLDAITMGYTLVLSQDIKVDLESNGMPVLSWRIDDDSVVSVGERTEPSGFPKILGYHPHEFIWKSPVAIEAPRGYSILVTHPINRYDLPFLTLSGVVDADSVMSHGNMPFILKEGFEGIIEAGTPILQIIPIKREIWEKEFSEDLDNKSNKNVFLSDRVMYGWYKKNIWTRKEYR